MSIEPVEDHILEFEPESRLVTTLITGRPGAGSTFIALSFLAVVALVTQANWGESWGLDLSVSYHKLFSKGEWWLAFTATLVHADFGHLLSNSYMLLIFSYFVYGYFGSMAFPLGSFLLAGLVNVITVTTIPEKTNLLGASGLVYLLGGFWLTSYFLVQRQHSVFPRLLRVLGIALMVFFPTTFVPTTSYMAHAVGFGVGMAFAFIYFLWRKQWIRSFERHKFSMIPVDSLPH